jgi:8-oxo-dGTP pyrophosphatase MutT (NUDIX family)
MMNNVAIRDAATVIVLRDATTAPRVLMGQRSANAAFMPAKFVFPGGAVDAADTGVPLAGQLSAVCAGRLAQDSDLPASALAAAAIRELWEETGQRLSSPGHWSDPQPDWQGFAATGHLPDPSALRFIFRAITPPGAPRRFDARFFLADAAALSTDPDDFSLAAPELSAVQWVPLADARSFALPFITQIVLAEVTARLRGHAPTTIPFMRHDDEAHEFARLSGASPFDRV